MITRKYLLSIELNNNADHVIKKNYVATYTSLFPDAAKAIGEGGKRLMELHPGYQVYVAFWRKL